MRPLRYLDERRTDATRRRLYAGAGLCLGSALGVATASAIDLPVASALFGAAVPVLAAQVWRDRRLLRHHQRHEIAADASGQEAAQ